VSDTAAASASERSQRCLIPRPTCLCPLPWRTAWPPTPNPTPTGATRQGPCPTAAPSRARRWGAAH